MSLKKLMKLVVPPKKPTEPGTKAKWAKVEKELGTPLPADCKEFIDRYGTGFFAELFYVFNPFAASADHNLIDQFKELGEYYRQQRQEDQEEYPYEVFPKKPGLLPWGRDNVGNTYFWLVEPKLKPDAWPVIFFEPRGSGFQKHDCSFSEYLEGIITGKINAPVQNYPDPEFLKFDAFEPEVPVSPAALFNAIFRNDLAQATKLLDAGVDPNSEFGGQSMLSVSTNHRDLVIAKLLVERGANVKGDPSLVFYTAQSGNLEAVNFLLDGGADPDGGRSNEATALAAATDLGNVPMVQALLAKGANPNARDERGNTPIFRAVRENDAETIRILAEHGADLTVRNNEGQTPLQLATERNRNYSIAALEAAAKSGKKT